MTLSRLDQVYRSILLTKFFKKGWGKPENLKRLFEFRKLISDQQTCQQLVPYDYPVIIDTEEIWSDCRIMEGHFISPFIYQLPGLLPKESENAYFQMILPKEWKNKLQPVCIHLAGTGDHYFWRRRSMMARPLLKEAGIASVLLENPFYGLRKPKDQVWSSLNNVSDIFIMGGCLVLECLVLLRWCEKQGFGPLGLTGISMGGHMASLAATNWLKPIVLVPCLSWTTASAVFTKGVLSGAIDWSLLETQYISDAVYKDQIKKMVNSPEQTDEDAFQIGRHFAKNFPKSMEHIEELQKEKVKTARERREETVLMNYASGISQKSISKSSVDIVPKSSNDINQVNSFQLHGEHDVSTSIFSDPCKNSDSKGISLHNLSSTYSSTNEKSTENSDTKFKRKKKSSFTYIPPKIIQSLAYSKSKIMGRTANEILYIPKDKTKISYSKLDKTELRSLAQREVLSFMNGIMDECTHLKNFSVPVDTSLIIIVAAKSDAYVPRKGIIGLTDIWPEAEIRYIDAGHIWAYLLHRDVFRIAIQDAFKRATEKYYNP